jgi:hypothetical protein
MFNQDIHISDNDLLLVADGELSNRRLSHVQIHLTECWNCRARMAEIDGTALDFAKAYRETSDTELLPMAGARALLTIRLAELASKSNIESWNISRKFSGALQAAAVFIVLFSAALVGRSFLRNVEAHHAKVGLPPLEQGVVPDSHLTPGAIGRAKIGDLCSAPHEEVVGQVTTPLRNKVLNEYRIVDARAGDYEIDYLVAPGLGGTEDIRNLWPQPYTAQIWNAYTKDTLEERFHQLVCERQLDLAVAQRDIASNWIAAYKKYFHTDRPKPLNAVLVPHSFKEFQ